MTTPPPERTVPVTYQVGVFALVQQRNQYLLVRPRRPLLPGGNYGLPGLLLSAEAGSGVAELSLRRALLAQVGISVSDLRLVGSHAARGTESGQEGSRLYLIFGTEYCSGILNPQPAELYSAEWMPASSFDNRTPEWLHAAVREYQTSAAPTPSPSVFGRKR
ncbi:NUDIX domain-containing protein [Deinococcus aquatilis]|uniref:NUDIX domain-containing protein n=1 Tax=Deinococcus aquatilis TaxID=519440 RepID=UPI000371AFB5|nr:NUDIX domain-containing protein [Deinococcus aquatilis]